MTISTEGNTSSRTVRVISRSRRLRRLRSTADLRCLGTMIPTRGYPARKREALIRTSKCSVRRRFPVRAISRSSVPRVMRRLLGKVADVRGCVWRRVTAAGAYAPAYLVGSLTVSCFRPFLRRRASTSRPHLSDMRRRKPCVRIRRLLRGR